MSAVPRSETAEERNKSVGVVASVSGQLAWIHIVLVDDNFYEVTSRFGARTSCFIEH